MFFNINMRIKLNNIFSSKKDHGDEVRREKEAYKKLKPKKVTDYSSGSPAGRGVKYIG